MSPDLSHAFGPIITVLGVHFIDKEIVLGVQRLLKPCWLHVQGQGQAACLLCCPPEVCLPLFSTAVNAVAWCFSGNHVVSVDQVRKVVLWH